MAISGVFARAPRVTILFVDDDSDTRFVYRCLAESEGFDVEVAGDGHEAIALASIVRPDVIVLDWRLPDMEGLEVVRRLRRGAPTRAIPIIIVSGDDSEGVRAAVSASGCEGHMLKPCSGDALLDLARDLARRVDEPRAMIRSASH
jgi:CheY-like chemotaxis protein